MQKKKKLFFIGGLTLAGACVVLVFIYAGPHLWFALQRVLHFKTPSLVQTFEEALKSIQYKVDELHRADADNHKLRLEVANLKLQLEKDHFQKNTDQAAKTSSALGPMLQSQTGSQIGRTLAQISFRPPQNLLPHQLYTLGLTYFKAHEDEKAAVIFTTLTTLKDNDAYQNPKDLLMTGVAWYKIDHFQLADSYFEHVLQFKETSESLPYQAQARLWRALVAEKEKKHLKAQYWLLDLVDHHPQAKETAWVNSKKEAK